MEFVGEIGWAPSLRHGIEFRIDEGAGDELLAAIRHNDPWTVTHDRALFCRLSRARTTPAWD